MGGIRLGARTTSGFPRTSAEPRADVTARGRPSRRLNLLSEQIRRHPRHNDTFDAGSASVCLGRSSAAGLSACRVHLRRGPTSRLTVDLNNILVARTLGVGVGKLAIFPSSRVCPSV